MNINITHHPPPTQPLTSSLRDLLLEAIPEHIDEQAGLQILRLWVDHLYVLTKTHQTEALVRSRSPRVRWEDALRFVMQPTKQDKTQEDYALGA